jgi:hypothetical protein
MAAKQEAEQLVNKFVDQPIRFPYIDTEDGQCIGGGQMTHDSAKQCALIAVDEIIKAHIHNEGVRHLKWWQEVKQEIKKL